MQSGPAVFVVADDAVGGVEDGIGAAVVFLQSDHGGIGWTSRTCSRKSTNRLKIRVQILLLGVWPAIAPDCYKS